LKPLQKKIYFYSYHRKETLDSLPLVNVVVTFVLLIINRLLYKLYYIRPMLHKLSLQNFSSELLTLSQLKGATTENRLQRHAFIKETPHHQSSHVKGKREV